MVLERARGPNSIGTASCGKSAPCRKESVSGRAPDWVTGGSEGGRGGGWQPTPSGLPTSLTNTPKSVVHDWPLLEGSQDLGFCSGCQAPGRHLTAPGSPQTGMLHSSLCRVGSEV